MKEAPFFSNFSLQSLARPQRGYACIRFVALLPHMLSPPKNFMWGLVAGGVLLPFLAGFFFFFLEPTYFFKVWFFLLVLTSLSPPPLEWFVWRLSCTQSLIPLFLLKALVLLILFVWGIFTSSPQFLCPPLHNSVLWFPYLLYNGVDLVSSRVPPPLHKPRHPYISSLTFSQNKNIFYTYAGPFPPFLYDWNPVSPLLYHPSLSLDLLFFANFVPFLLYLSFSYCPPLFPFFQFSFSHPHEVPPFHSLW